MDPWGDAGTVVKLPDVDAFAFTTPKARAMAFVSDGALPEPWTLTRVEIPAMRMTAAATAKSRRGCVHEDLT